MKCWHYVNGEGLKKKVRFAHTVWKNHIFPYEELFHNFSEWSFPSHALLLHPVLFSILALITPHLIIPCDFFLFSLLNHLPRVFNPSSFHTSENRKGRTSFSSNIYQLEISLNCINGNKIFAGQHVVFLWM